MSPALCCLVVRGRKGSQKYYVPHPTRTPAGIACVRFEWLGGAFSRTQIRKPRSARIWGVWRDSNSPLILFESRGYVALFICLIHKRSARQPQGDSESRCKGFALRYGVHFKRGVAVFFELFFLFLIQAVLFCCGIAGVVVLCNADCCRLVRPAGPFHRSVVLR